METMNSPKTIHIGRKVGRLRELLGIKQDVVADKLGISQQAVSKLEQSENIEDATLERVAKALGVNIEAIKNFSEESVINNIQNNYEGSNKGAASVFNTYPYQCTFNPLEKYVEALARLEALNEENKKLYEALLASEREKVAMLQKMLDTK